MPKPVSPEKLQELLLKVRKGATASFNWSTWSAVLSHLGGSVEPIVGVFAELVAKWRPRALPIEGGVEINWYVEGRK